MVRGPCFLKTSCATKEIAERVSETLQNTLATCCRNFYATVKSLIQLSNLKFHQHGEPLGILFSKLETSGTSYLFPVHVRSGSVSIQLDLAEQEPKLPLWLRYDGLLQELKQHVPGSINKNNEKKIVDKVSEQVASVCNKMQTAACERFALSLEQLAKWQHSEVSRSMLV